MVKTAFHDLPRAKFLVPEVINSVLLRRRCEVDYIKVFEKASERSVSAFITYKCNVPPLVGRSQQRAQGATEIENFSISLKAYVLDRKSINVIRRLRMGRKTQE